MSKQAVEFLEGWIDEHVIQAEIGADSTRATALAGMCREAAATLGISFDEIQALSSAPLKRSSTKRYAMLRAAGRVMRSVAEPENSAPPKMPRCHH